MSEGVWLLFLDEALIGSHIKSTKTYVNPEMIDGKLYGSSRKGGANILAIGGIVGERGMVTYILKEKSLTSLDVIDLLQQLVDAVE